MYVCMFFIFMQLYCTCEPNSLIGVECYADLIELFVLIFMPLQICEEVYKNVPFVSFLFVSLLH